MPVARWRSRLSCADASATDHSIRRLPNTWAFSLTRDACRLLVVSSTVFIPGVAGDDHGDVVVVDLDPRATIVFCCAVVCSVLVLYMMVSICV